MDVKELLTGFLGKTLNMPAEKVASLFNEDGTVKDTAKDEILALDATRVQAFKAEETTAHDNGYKKAQREVLDLREKEIKDKYALTSSKKGIELIEEIVTLKAGEKANLEPDKVKLHPEYIKLQDELTKKAIDAETTWKKKYDDREKEIDREKTFGVVSTKADTILAEYGLPKDAKLSANQKKLLYEELKSFGFQPNGEDFVIIDGEGKVKNDAHGNRISFDTLVHEIASKYWPKLDGEERSGAGANNDPAGKGSAVKPNAYKGKIKTENDYVAALSQPNLTAEMRIDIDAEYTAVTNPAK